jgi:hypothetical protein
MADEAGTMLVTDKAGDVKVDTEGKGQKEVIDDQQTRYTGFGTATVTGSDLEVVITGSSLDIEAAGTGQVIMKGSGTYYTEKDSTKKEFTAEEVTIQFQPRQAALDTQNQ